MAAAAALHAVGPTRRTTKRKAGGERAVGVSWVRLFRRLVILPSSASAAVELRIQETPTAPLARLPLCGSP